MSMMILSLKEECDRGNHEYLNEGLKGEYDWQCEKLLYENFDEHFNVDKTECEWWRRRQSWIL